MPGRLFRHVGRDVCFKNPGTGVRVWGRIIDEVWTPEPESFGEVAPRSEDGWLETAFVAQLVEWESGRRIRIAYYTRRPGGGPKDWVYAQFAASLAPDELSTLVSYMNKNRWLDAPDRGEESHQHQPAPVRQST